MSSELWGFREINGAVLIFYPIANAYRLFVTPVEFKSYNYTMLRLRIIAYVTHRDTDRIHIEAVAGVDRRRDVTAGIVMLGVLAVMYVVLAF